MVGFTLRYWTVFGASYQAPLRCWWDGQQTRAVVGPSAAGDWIYVLGLYGTCTCLGLPLPKFFLVFILIIYILLYIYIYYIYLYYIYIYIIFIYIYVYITIYIYIYINIRRRFHPGKQLVDFKLWRDQWKSQKNWPTGRSINSEMLWWHGA